MLSYVDVGKVLTLMWLFAGLDLVGSNFTENLDSKTINGLVVRELKICKSAIGSWRLGAPCGR